ncbi:outer membrane beta-barrel protein [Halorhodospira halochloris]|uniref:outer membrane beta-barrel protein n=1 Tax=Halorhodospira halochloris TaxID=1052 RepID=UPI001EE7B1D2|nr:outer membrane beta-barrel protein [Halorhodospira halochloris]MCG5548610.1 porin family protein [Halorhodospira halochloris]
MMNYLCKKTALRVFCAAAMSLFSLCSFAAPKFDQAPYGGLQISFVDVDYGWRSEEEASFTTALGRLGIHASERFAAEVRFGTGVTKDSVGYYNADDDVDLEIKYILGAYGLWHAHLVDLFSVYGLLGVTRAEAEASTSGGSLSEEETGFSSGFGAAFYFTDRVTINIEYISYINSSNSSTFDVDGLSGGLSMFF